MRGRLWHNTAERGRERPREEVLGEASLEGLVKGLAQANRTELRRSAAERLGRLGTEAAPAIPALLISSVDVDAGVREAALAALGAIDPAWPRTEAAREAFSVLVAALRSWSTEVSRAAFSRLSEIGQPSAPELAGVLSAGDDTVANVHAIRLLGRIGPGAAIAVPGLTRALASQYVQVRIEAAEALASVGPLPDATAAALAAGLADRYAEARRAMAACLGRLGAAAEPAVPALIPLLADREPKVRTAAAMALEHIGPGVLPALIEVVRTRDLQRLKAWARLELDLSQWHGADEAAVRLDPQNAVRNLFWLAYDILEDRLALETAQVAALQVLGKFGAAAEEAVLAIVAALADGSPHIRLAAVRSLGEIGPAAAAAVPALTAALKDSEQLLQEEAARALAKIVPPAESPDPAGADPVGP